MFRTLVLFDIDGTLLKVGSMNRRVLSDALIEVYGTDGSTSSKDFSGKMDSSIIYEVLSSAGLKRTQIAKKFNKAREAYTALFRKRARREDITLCEGVRELLNALSERNDVLLGLVTGNFEGSGRHKLKLPDLDRYFPFGAFADDAIDRNELPRIALERAQRMTGTNYSPAQIVIIGDTEHDIRCARTIEARSIAVATGNFTMEELARHNPDALFRNFAETDKVLAEIVTPQHS